MPFSILQHTLTKRGYWKGAVSGSGNDDATDNSEGEGAADNGDDGQKEDDKPGDNKNSQPSDSEAKLLKEVMKRKARVAEQETEITNLKAQLSKFEGINLDEVNELINTKKDAETRQLEEKGQWEALKAQMKAENAKLVKEQADKVAELQALTAKQQATIDKLTVGNSFGSSKFLNELNLSPEKARKLYGEHFDISDDGVVAYDKPKGDAGRVQLVNADGESINFDEALKKIVDADPDRDLLYKSRKKDGAGSTTLGGKKLPGNPVILTGVDKIQAALDKGNK
ncbi:MAG: DUF6651 domain-containing protein [Methylobacter sp.]